MNVMHTYRTSRAAPQEMKYFGGQRSRSCCDELYFSPEAGLNLLEYNFVPYAIISNYTPVSKKNMFLISCQRIYTLLKIKCILNDLWNIESHWFKLPGRTFCKIEKDSYFFSSFSLLAKAILNSFFFIPDPEFIWLITFEEKTTFLSKILEISIFIIAK